MMVPQALRNNTAIMTKARSMVSQPPNELFTILITDPNRNVKFNLVTFFHLIVFMGELYLSRGFCSCPRPGEADLQLCARDSDDADRYAYGHL